MSDACEVVVERVALGEPLGELADHAASCARCRRVAALPTELGVVRHASDPGLGFTARMTAGAQQRITARRRRRVAGGLAVAVAATAAGVFVFTREPPRTAPLAEAPRPPAETQPAAIEVPGPDPWSDPHYDDSNPSELDDDVRALVQLANTERSRRLSAPWRRIAQPLEPYRIVLEGVEP